MMKRLVTATLVAAFSISTFAAAPSLLSQANTAPKEAEVTPLPPATPVEVAIKKKGNWKIAPPVEVAIKKKGNWKTTTA